MLKAAMGAAYPGLGARSGNGACCGTGCATAGVAVCLLWAALLESSSLHGA
jgi:hypothetical protein